MCEFCSDGPPERWPDIDIKEEINYFRERKKLYEREISIATQEIDKLRKILRKRKTT